LRKLITLIKFDLRCLIRPGAVFVLLAAVILMGSVYLSLPEGLFEGAVIEPFDIAIADNGGDVITNMIISEIRGMDIFSDIRIVTPERGLALLEQGEIAAFANIPVGLEDSMIFNIPAVIEVHGSAYFPIQAAVMEAAAESAARGVSAVQADVYVFNYLAADFFEERADFVRARSELAANLMFMSLGRNAAVSVDAAAASGFAAQLLAIALFISAALVSIYVSIDAAARWRERSVATIKLALRGTTHAIANTNYDFLLFAAAKCIAAIALTAVAAAAAVLLIGVFGIDGIYPARIFVGTAILAVALFPVNLMFSFLLKQPEQTALCGFGFMFCALFLGGVYPAFLTGRALAFVARFSPSAIALEAAAWSLGGNLTHFAIIPLVVSLLFLLLAARLWKSV
jgi:hypothetical protein